jgi:O-antigen ligase
VPFTVWIAVPQASIPRLSAAAALFSLGLGWWQSEERVGRSAFDLAVAGIVVMTLLSWQLGSHPPHSLREAVNFLAPLALYPAARRFARQQGIVVGTLLCCGALASLTLYYEYFISHAPLFIDKTAYYWNAGGNFIFRPGGVFGSPPGAGAVLAVVALLGLPLVGSARGLLRLAAAFAVLLCVGALILTFTRGALIGFGAGLLVYIAVLRPPRWGRVIFVPTLLALLLVLLVLPRISGTTWYQEGLLRGGTFSQRQSYWALSWPLITNSPQHLVVGHGINSLLVGRPELPGKIDADIAAVPTLTLRGPHNQYVRTLLEEGLVGLGLLVAWLLGTVAAGVRASYSSVATRPWLAAGVAAVAAVGVLMLVGDALRHPPTFALLSVAAGCVVTWARDVRYSEEEVVWTPTR